MKEIIIDDANSNQRFDKFLKKLIKEGSTSFIYKMLRKKNIVLNDKKATGNEILSKGDSVKIFFSDETYEKMTGGENSKDPEFEQLKTIDYSRLDIIFEDSEKIIINKPSGILSQKATPKDISINEIALSYLINNGELTENSFRMFHPSVVNRLDRNTSGIIIFAKTLSAAQNLSKMMKERTAKKIYHAIVIGNLNNKQTITGYLKKDETTNKVTIKDKEFEDARYIETEYTPIRPINDEISLLEIHLITGRTHQIRAHLASIGHPILGDFKYGNSNLNKKYKIKDQLLHAYSIEFPDGTKYVAEEPEQFNVNF